MHSQSATKVARYRFGALVLDPARRELQRDGDALLLPARALECLLYLIEHRDRAVGRDELVQAVFARPDVSDAQLAQIVLRARRAIGDDGQGQRAIRTVPRFGFRWCAPVTVLEEATPEAASVALPGPANEPAATETPCNLAADPVEPFACATAAARRTVAWRWRTQADFGFVTALFVALMFLFGPWPWDRSGVADAHAGATGHGAIVVLPLHVSGPGDATWARLGMMDYVVDRMRRADLPVWSSEATLSLLRAGDHAQPDPQWLRRHTDAEWIVRGHARRERQRWQVTLTATDGTGLMQRGVASDVDLVAATRVAGDRLMSALGAVSPGGASASTGLEERMLRAQAAVLANELDVARRILLAAPELQRSAPQLGYRLAQIDFRAGRNSAGLAAVTRLLGSREAIRDATFRGQLLTLRGSFLMRLDRHAEAAQSFDEAVAQLESRSGGIDLGRALNGRGSAHSARQQFDAALSDLGQARVQLLRSGDRLAVARVDGNLGIVEMERRRPQQAVQYFAKAERDFEAMGAANELAGVRSMLTASHLQLLQTGAALAVSERGWAMRSRVRDPTQVADLLLARAEALIGAGRLREARELLRMPEAGGAAATDFGRREFLQAELARQAGDTRSVAMLATVALQDWPAGRNPRLRAWMQVRRNEAALQADLPVLREAPDVFAGDPLARTLDAALRDRRAGRDMQAGLSYQEAMRLAESGGIPGEIAHAAIAYAHWLMQTGELDEAASLAGRVAPWAEHDFELAMLQVELYRRMEQPREWRAALEHAHRLAGERPIPAELSLAPRPTGAVATASP